MIQESCHVQNSKSLPKSEYDYLHIWIRRKFGRATKCQSPDCVGRSNYYDWALIKGKKYEKDIKNFWQLCRSCHLKYDYSQESKDNVGRRMAAFWAKPENKEILRTHRTGTKHREEVRREMSDSRSGEKNPMYGRRIVGAANHMFGKSHSETTRRAIAGKARKLNERQVRLIRYAAELGCPQIDLSKVFNSSRASISRVVNQRRYVL